MAAQTAARETKKRESYSHDFPVQNGVIIYKGGVVIIDTDGYAQPVSGSPALANGDIYMGICRETVDNSAGVDGTKRVVAEMSGIFELPFTSIAQADVGSEVYINNTTDDALFTQTAVLDDPQVKVGVLVGVVSSTKGLVRIDNHIGQLAATTAS